MVLLLLTEKHVSHLFIHSQNRKDIFKDLLKIFKNILKRSEKKQYSKIASIILKPCSSICVSIWMLDLFYNPQWNLVNQGQVNAWDKYHIALKYLK